VRGLKRVPRPAIGITIFSVCPIDIKKIPNMSVIFCFIILEAPFFIFFHFGKVKPGRDGVLLSSSIFAFLFRDNRDLGMSRDKED